MARRLDPDVPAGGHHVEEDEEGEVGSVDSQDESDATVGARNRSILEGLRFDLIHRMVPSRVLGQLQKLQLFNQSDREEVMSQATTEAKNDKLVDLLLQRGADAPARFVHALWPVHITLAEEIASKLWPTRSRVLWFVENPTHAATVVDLLQESQSLGFGVSFTFSGTERASSNCIFQRGLVFGDQAQILFQEERGDVHGLEVVVAFPVSSISAALEAAFSEVCRDPDMVVMSGVCRGKRWAEGGRQRVRHGDTIVVTQALDGPANPVGPSDDHVRSVQELFGAGSTPEWKKEVERMKHEEASLRHQTLWLTRLYLELKNMQVPGARGRVGRQPSSWISNLGWDMEQPSLLSEANQAAIARHLPDWASGKLQSTLLKERRLWQIDRTSPLGMSPCCKLEATVERILPRDPLFPSPLSQQMSGEFPLPHFGTMATTEEEREPEEPGESAPLHSLATDHTSCLFYSTCKKWVSGKPRLVCKGVSYEVGGGERACVFASSCVLLEAVKMFARENAMRREASLPDSDDDD